MCNVVFFYVQNVQQVGDKL